MAETRICFRGNDMALLITDVKDRLDVVIAEADVEVTLKETDGTLLSGQSWPLPVPADAVAGEYAVTLVDTIVYPPDTQRILADITIDNGTNKRAKFEQPIIVETREDL